MQNNTERDRIPAGAVDFLQSFPWTLPRIEAFLASVLLGVEPEEPTVQDVHHENSLPASYSLVLEEGEEEDDFEEDLLVESDPAQLALDKDLQRWMEERDRTPSPDRNGSVPLSRRLQGVQDKAEKQPRSFNNAASNLAPVRATRLHFGPMYGVLVRPKQSEEPWSALSFGNEMHLLTNQCAGISKKFQLQKHRLGLLFIDVRVSPCRIDFWERATRIDKLPCMAWKQRGSTPSSSVLIQQTR